MLIRSQDKKTFINLDITCRFSVIKNSSIIITADGITMGEYSTKEKALKVLDMIQEAYMDFESAKITSTGLATAAYTGNYDTPESVAGGIKVLKGYAEMIRESVVFQMPEDGSVEE